MLGTLYDEWDKAESVHIREGEKFIIVRGKRLEVKIEKDNHLRLSLIETGNNRGKQHREALANVTNLLDNRRKDLAMIKQELTEIMHKLANEDLNEIDEEDLFQELRDKKAIKKNHEIEIPKLEALKTVRVNYRVFKTGLTAVLAPGLTLQPGFLSEPVCWRPENMPASHPVEKITSLSEVMPINCGLHLSATGFGLENCALNVAAKFVITTKDIEGQLCDVNRYKFVVESKEAEIKYSVLRKEKGRYEVSYSSVAYFIQCEQIFLAVTYLGRHVPRSPFAVKIRRLLLELSSSDNPKDDWLDSAVKTMSNIPRARLWVHVYDKNGSEVYLARGVTSCKWTQNHITAPNVQYYENKHTNIILLDNEDSMMIIGKKGAEKAVNYSNWSNHWGNDAYRSYNIIINKGYFRGGHYNNRRRLIIARSAPYVPHWTSPENVISFSKSGFTQTLLGNWPKFNGIFRIYYTPL